MTEKRRRKNACIKGSYTVEAALLMGILLAVLVAVIDLGFYFHDKGFVQGAAHEAACAGSLWADEENRALSGAASGLAAGRLLGTKGISCSVTEGVKEISVSYSGELMLPGMISGFFGGTRIPVRGQVSLTTQRPSARIQKIRGAVKIVKEIQGE